jgi:Bacterial Ig-like domain (group 2)
MACITGKSIRDSLLPALNSLRAIPATMGLRRFSVTIRRRVWSGLTPGEGTATDYDILLTPPPRVVDITERQMDNTEGEYKAINSGVIFGNVYKIDRITPAFSSTVVCCTSNGVATVSTGGYLAEQIRLWPNRDTGAVENLVALVGDDGYLRECEQVTFNQSDPFSYSMMAKEVDRPKTPLVSVAVASVSVVHGKTAQLVAIGTFNGGATSILTTLCAWSSSATSVATVDIYGNVTAVAAGTATITALVLGKTTTATVTVM